MLLKGQRFQVFFTIVEGLSGAYLLILKYHEHYNFKSIIHLETLG